MKSSGYAKVISALLSAVIVIAGMPFTASSASTAPKLTIETKNFNPSELPDDHNVTIEVSVSNNTGSLASSFGICYDDALILHEATINEAGEEFEGIINEEKNLIWFVSASGSSSTDSSDGILMELTFELSEQAAEGGSFPIQFVWTGVDGSDSYWYAEKGVNLIEDIQKNAKNGSINIHGSSTLSHTELRMNQETQQQLSLYNVVGTPKWLSTNPKVATVTQDGLVTAVSAGECMIRVNIDRTFKDCHVIVNEADVYSILDEKPLMITNPERDIVLEYPGVDDTAEILWGSFDPSSIDIDETGKLIFTRGISCNATIYSEYNGDAPMRDIFIEYTEEPDETSEPTEAPTEEFSETSEPTEFPTEESSEISEPTEFPTEESSEISEPTEFSTEESTEISESSEPVSYILGDVDGNGGLDIVDVIIVNKAILGKEFLTPEQNLAADFNCDTKINTNDSLDMLKKIVGLI